MTDLRTHKRVPCRFRTFYQAGHVATWWWGSVADVSAGGLRLRTYRPLDPGVVLEFDLSLSEPRRARVVHIEQARETGYLVGCCFLRALTCDEFEMLQGQVIAQEQAWRHSE